ncbi:hypothetical protein [Polaromonas sp. CG_9.11]|uniref:hypothetical protein n=1 Tax=Polaromonas sp. CG_9.11 TaxID=2787730 RepID=UPI0018CA58DD|nr:hypothetical protein [Polaromonas sp. CG_9.11]MBG6077753.1 hypothetical protein [Polaromonas sp. CG_9.11]
MRTPFFFAIALCSLFSARAAEPLSSAPVPAPHPLIGSWSWSLPGKPCTEQLRYSANGMRQSSSGDETTQGHYEVAAIPSLIGFYRLTETVTDGNGKRDCSGDLHEAPGKAVTRFIQFSPSKDQLIVCREESLKACFGPLKHLPG